MLQVFPFYEELFPPSRLNPNGCPASVTFFLSHNWTDYSMVTSLRERGHEVASHSVTHRMPQSWWRYASREEWRAEIIGQRDNIVQHTAIPSHDVRGMRAPFLDTGGDNQYDMLRENDMSYDASFMTGPHDAGGAWPFTLDFVANWKYCSNLNCPKAKHPGIWQVPLNRWVGIDGKACSMVDSCETQPTHQGETLTYLWQNFNRFYYGNRAPFGVNMHATWLQSEHNLLAMTEFVRTLAQMDDVYLVSVQQVLAWMRDPKTLDRIKTFEPWRSSCSATELNNNNVAFESSADVNEPIAPQQNVEQEQPATINFYVDFQSLNEDTVPEQPRDAFAFDPLDGYPDEFYQANWFERDVSMGVDDVSTNEAEVRAGVYREVVGSSAEDETRSEATLVRGEKEQQQLARERTDDVTRERARKKMFYTFVQPLLLLFFFAARRSHRKK